MKKISIIIPMYNVEKYIGRCIDSILNQTYENFELLLIDDGSTDSTSKIIHSYKDNRIVYIYQNNMGVSSARNNGILKCVGDFITFVDADDWLNDDALEKMVDLIQNENCDCIKTNYNYVIENGEKRIVKKNENILDHYKITIDDVIGGRFNCYVWLLMVKRNVLNNIKFNTEMPMMEDNYFYFKVLINGFLIKSFDVITYNYFINTNGASLNVKNYEKNLKSIIKLREMINLDLGDSNLFKLNNTNIMKCVLAILKDVYKKKRGDYRKSYEFIRENLFKKEESMIIKNNLDLTEKIMYYLLKKDLYNLSRLFLYVRIIIVKLIKVR